MTSLLRAAGFVSSATSVSLFVACATNEPALPPGDESVVMPPASTPDAADPADAATDGPRSEDLDSGPCDDCAHFPETCTADVLCTHPVVDTLARLHFIRGRSETDVWAAGAHGTLLHFDGTAWSPSNAGTNETIHSMWLRPSSEVSFVTLGSIYSRGISVPNAGAPSADGWTAQGVPDGAPFGYENSLQLEDTFAAPGAEWLWCATMDAYGFILPGFLGSGLWRLRVSPSTNALEADYAVPLSTCADYPCSSMTSVHGASADTLWAVGFKGATFRITDAQGATPGIEQFNSQTWASLFGVWAAANDDVWSVGGAGAIRHYTGTGPAWDVVADVPTTENLNGVWGSSSSDVWAVGDRGVVLHYDGKTWSRVNIAGLGLRRPNLYSVWAPSPGHVWIGGDGVLLSLGGKP